MIFSVNFSIYGCLYGFLPAEFRFGFSRLRMELCYFWRTGIIFALWTARIGFLAKDPSIDINSSIPGMVVFGQNVTNIRLHQISPWINLTHLYNALELARNYSKFKEFRICENHPQTLNRPKFSQGRTQSTVLWGFTLGPILNFFEKLTPDHSEY